MRMLVLSGGGAGLFAYVGAWRALQEAGWVPDRVAGTSAGALAGAFFAAGLARELEEVALRYDGRSLWGTTLSSLPEYVGAGIRLYRTRGLLDPRVLHREVDRYLTDGVLRAMRPRSFEAYAVDVRTGQVVVGYGATAEPEHLRQVVKGSMAIPFVFPPVKSRDPEVGDKLELRDGGVTHNHPTLSALTAHRALAAGEEWDCLVLDALDPYRPGKPGGVVEEAGQLLAILMHRQAREARELLERHRVPFRWIVLPTDISLLNFTRERAREVMDLGYAEVRRRMDDGGEKDGRG